MTSPLRIGIVGLGTVGSGTLKIITAQAALLEERCGRKVVIAGISAQDKSKKRGFDTSAFAWFDDPVAMAVHKDIDVVVETIGGSEGIARETVEAALKKGKSVVTANKALIAYHGVELARLAEKNNAILAFEAAVAGGIPIIKSLRDGLAANRINRIAGVLNGTCNFILTTMWERKCSFDHALAEAQNKGYAESDPSFDIEGRDTAHKLAILASLAYGMPPSLATAYVEGIDRISLRDMEFAAELGYTIKLLGLAEETQHGISQRVHPCMVPAKSALASVPGATNAVMIDGDAVGTVFFEGLGAGAGPTASSVVADIMDIARGAAYKPFTLPVDELKKLPLADMNDLVSSYYLRLSVIDRPGVLAAVTGILRDEQISLRSFIQHSHKPGEPVQVVLTTHETREASMQKAITSIARLENVQEKPHMIRIENM
jgi:homoserine dehydrogenase